MCSTTRRSFTLSILIALSVIAAACGDTTSDATDPANVADVADSAEVSMPTTVAVQEETTDSEITEETAAAEITEAPEDEPLAEADDAARREELTLALTNELRAWQEGGGIPGASLSVRLPDGDQINIAVGVADIVTEVPVTTDDFFRIGSITKPMTAAVVLQLIDEGLIELDEPVETYLPGWLEGYEYADEITIRQLMDHTNGLVEYALSPEFFAVAGQRTDVAITSGEIRDWLAQQTPLFAPGMEYSYETGGFLTLGDVIETVTGESAAAQMRKRIFEPADAENIYLTPQEFPPTPTVNAYGRAEMYLAGTLLIGREDIDKLTINDEPVIAMYGQPQDVLQSAGWTGGGNEAQLESVSAIMAALFDGTILSDEQIDLMTTTVLDSSYGLGIDVSEVDGILHYSHGGGVPGFRSQGNYLPDYDISWAVSVNMVPLPEGSRVGDLRQRLLPILLEAN